MDEFDFNRSHDITIEEVKSFPMFAHFSEEQALEVVETIKRLADIIYNDYMKNDTKKD